MNLQLWGTESHITAGHTIIMFLAQFLTHFVVQGSRSKSGQVFTIGVVGRCLSKALVEGKKLEYKCRDLVCGPKESKPWKYCL